MEFLSVKQVAEKLGITENKVREMCRNGTIDKYLT